MYTSRKGLWWLPFILAVLLLACQSEEQVRLRAADWGSIPERDSLEGYLVANLGITSHGGQAFCAYESLEAGESADGKRYLWVVCQECYREQGELESGSGSSLPVELQLLETDGHLRVIGHRVPRDGTYYGADVRALFPKSCWPQIMPRSRNEQVRYNDRASRLAEATMVKADLHYGVD